MDIVWILIHYICSVCFLEVDEKYEVCHIIFLNRIHLSGCRFKIVKGS